MKSMVEEEGDRRHRRRKSRKSCGDADVALPKIVSLVYHGEA